VIIDRVAKLSSAMGTKIAFDQGKGVWTANAQASDAAR
jgi:hypothetical protein